MSTKLHPASDTAAAARAPRVMYGDAGDNAFRVNHAADRIIERPHQGTDTAYATVSYTLPPNVENLVLTGGGALNAVGNGEGNRLVGNDNRNRLEGKDGRDFLFGNGGNDELDGGSGADVMAGGNGHDLYRVDDSRDTITELAGQGTDSVFSSADYVLPAHVENLILTAQAVRGTGNGENNRLTGNAAGNLLRGEGGNDWIDGRGGNDDIRGGHGSDTLYGGAGNDRLMGGTDAYPIRDEYSGLRYWRDTNDGDDYLDGGSGNDTLYGGHGHDTYFFAKGYGTDIIIDYRVPGEETLYDPEEGNTVRFGSGLRPQDLEIKAGLLGDGRADDVWKIGIKGTQDTLIVHNQSAGNEAAVQYFAFDGGTYRPWELKQMLGVWGNVKTLNIDNDNVYRLSEADFGVGAENGHPDYRYLIENVSGGRLAYLSSDGSIRQWVKSDVFYVHDSSDLVFIPNKGASSAGITFSYYSEDTFSYNRDVSHTLKFNLRDLPDPDDRMLFGDVNGNFMKGGAGNDLLHGLSGNDTLDGGAGDDRLYGGAGNDTYRFGRDGGRDTITDAEGSNTVRFAKGIKPQDLTLKKIIHPYGGETDWVIGFKDSEDTLTIQDQTGGRQAAIRQFVFDDATVGYTQLESRINSQPAAAAPAAKAEYAYGGGSAVALPDDSAVPLI